MPENDGYMYRLTYYQYHVDGDTTYLISRGDDDYYDMDLETMREVARKLKEKTKTFGTVTLKRRRLVPQPPWEDIEL